MHSRFIRNRLKGEFQLYNITLLYDLGIASLKSATAYHTRDQPQYHDVSSFFLSAPLSLADNNNRKNFAQEIRTASTLGMPLKVLLGGFYSRATSRAT